MGTGNIQSRKCFGVLFALLLCCCFFCIFPLFCFVFLKDDFAVSMFSYFFTPSKSKNGGNQVSDSFIFSKKMKTFSFKKNQEI